MCVKNLGKDIIDRFLNIGQNLRTISHIKVVPFLCIGDSSL